MKKLFLLLTSLILASCGGTIHSSTSYAEHSYSEISHLTIYYNQVFSIDSNDHLIYYYSETCTHCSELKNQIIEFALNQYKPIYFVVADITTPHIHDSLSINETIGSTDVNDVFVGVTPQLAVIQNNAVAKNIITNEFIEEELWHYIP